MSNPIQTINLADNINAAIHKINQNFQNAQGLTEEEVIDLILAELNKLTDDKGFTESEIRAFLASTTLDLGSNKILYSNVFSTVGDLPDASTYHGMFAHVHATGAAYFAHGGQWIELAKKSDVGTSDFDGDYNSLTNKPFIPSDLEDLDDVQFNSPVLVGHVLKWDGTKWTNLEDSSGGGGGPTDPGENGTSFYQATIYQRSTTQPATPSGGTFDFPSVTLTPPSGWSGTIPEGDDDLWACNFLFRDYLSQQGTITATDWSEPYRLAGLIDVNSNGESYAQLSIYRRWSPPQNDSGAVLLSPEGGSFDFDPSSNSPLTPPTDWYLTPPSVEDQPGDLYISAGIATTNGLDEGVTLDTNISWSQPQKTSTGLDGQPGRSIFEKAVYRRVQKPAGWSVGDDLPAPPKPVGGFFNFGEEIFGKTPPDVPAPLDDAEGNEGVWYAGVPPWDPTSGEPAGDVWSSVYAFSVVGDTGTDVAVDENWSEPTIGILESVSTYQKSLYARSTNKPTTDFTDNNVIYSFTHDKFLTVSGDSEAVNGIDGLPLWYEEPPELDLDNPMPLWSVTTTASMIGYLGEDRDLTFSDIKLALNYAIDAENGYSFVQLSVYKWSNTDLANNAGTPSGGSFDFSTKTFTQPSGWSKTIPDNPDENDENMKLYVSSGIASTQPNSGDSTDPIVVDDVIVWSTPDVTTAGGSGRDGRSTFRAVIVQRTTTNPPSSPTGGFVNFGADAVTRTQAEAAAANVTSNGILTIAGNSLVPPDGWYDTVAEIPTDEAPDGKIWAVEYQFATDGDTGVEVGGTWSAPYEDHNNGEDGYSTFSASVYKRSANKPAATGGKWGPVGAVYSFTDDEIVFTAQNIADGWSENPQESNTNLDPLWLCRATATTKGLTGTDATLTWSEPVKVSSDGKNGDPGSGIVVDLTNENHSITARFDGTLYPNSLDGASTSVQAFNGDDAIDLTNETISISSNVDQGNGPNNVNWTTTGLSTSITHVGANIDEFTLTFGVLNRSAVFTLTKIKAAAPGQPATVYRLISSASVIKANSNNTVHTPSTLTITKQKVVGGNAPAATTDGYLFLYGNGDTLVASSGDSESIDDYIIEDSTTQLRAVYEVGGVIVDEETIPIVFDGSNGGSGIVIDLTNENHSIVANNNGVAYNYDGAKTTFNAYDGDDVINIPEEDISVTPPSSSSNVEYSLSNGNKTLDVTKMANTVREATLTFTVSADSTTKAKGRSATFTLTKINDGENGQPATVYRLINSASVIKSNPNNTEHEPSKIFATAFKYTGGQEPEIALTGTTLILKTNDSDTEVVSESDGTLSWDVVDGTTSVSIELWVPDTNGVMVDQENIPVVFDGTDSGEVTVPPRFESGYVYYQVADASANGPQGDALPAATSFTFIGSGGNSGTDGVFDGLTDNWSANPPGSTNLEGTFWAARFTAFEDTAGGGVATSANGNLHFSTPFKNYSFNGLVTFENLEGELANMDPDTARITTIDGGKITTGELDADLVKIRKLTASSTTGARTMVTQDGVEVYSAGGTNNEGILRVKLGKLS